MSRVLLDTETRVSIEQVRSRLKDAMSACERSLQNTTTETLDVFAIGDEIVRAMVALEPVADAVLADPATGRGPASGRAQTFTRDGAVLSAAEALAHDVGYELSSQHPPGQERPLLDELLGNVQHGMAEVQNPRANEPRRAGRSS